MYKHTLYGITSYQRIEATASLACANKCFFCWRHHKNPVGKEWRWKTDATQQGVASHFKFQVVLFEHLFRNKKEASSEGFASLSANETGVFFALGFVHYNGTL
jgi:wyosine [tRNA(Phe)-imidazoG37] synthetase (radical SAM superfamily)